MTRPLLLIKSGDSGAPVWSPYAEDMITAYGTQSGVLDTQQPGQPGYGVQELNLNEWAVYSHIGEVEEALGVTVYTICC